MANTPDFQWTVSTDANITIDQTNWTVHTGGQVAQSGEDWNADTWPTLFVVKHGEATYVFENDSVIMYDGRVTHNPDVPDHVRELYRQALLRVELGNDNSIVQSGE